MTPQPLDTLGPGDNVLRISIDGAITRIIRHDGTCDLYNTHTARRLVLDGQPQCGLMGDEVERVMGLFDRDTGVLLVVMRRNVVSLDAARRRLRGGEVPF